MLRVVRSPFGFHGTINRTQFWLGMLAELIAVNVFGFLLPRLVPESTAVILFSLLLFGLIWVFLALHTKRLRDAGLSPWLCLLWIVPLVDLVVFVIAGLRPTAVKNTDAP